MVDHLPVDLDVDGDGFADVVVPRSADGRSPDLLVAYGSHAGLGPRQMVIPPPAGATGFGATGLALTSGRAIAGVGDVNGDGYGDLAVGASYAGERPARCGKGTDPDATGRVFIYSGGAQGINPQPTSILAGTEPGERFGTWVSGGSDVNGDGYADLLVGGAGGMPPATSCPHPEPSGALVKGRISVSLGGAPGALRSPHLVLSPDSWADGTGYTFRGGGIVGDVDNDGFGDAIITAATPGTTEWRVHFGSKAGLVRESSATLSGDFRTDGLARGLGLSTKTAVRVVLVPGQGRGPALIYGAVRRGAKAASARALALDRLAPNRVSAAVDVNGDGFSDLIVATSGAKRAFLFAGSPDGPRETPTPIEASDRPLRFATSLSVGDYDGDGYGDVALGGYTPPVGDVLYVYRGGPDGLSKVASRFVPSSIDRQAPKN